MHTKLSIILAAMVLLTSTGTGSVGTIVNMDVGHGQMFSDGHTGNADTVSDVYTTHHSWFPFHPPKHTTPTHHGHER
jgi:hypothetical protein